MRSVLCFHLKTSAIRANSMRLGTRMGILRSLTQGRCVRSIRYWSGTVVSKIGMPHSSLILCTICRSMSLMIVDKKLILSFALLGQPISTIVSHSTMTPSISLEHQKMPQHFISIGRIDYERKSQE